MVRERYRHLGIESSAATPDEIKRAYRRLAMQLHPDKPGGDAEKFKRLQESYEILSDPHKRAVYDRHGDAGLEEQEEQTRGGPFGGAFGGFGPGMPTRRRQAPSINIEARISMCNLYRGIEHAFTYTRQRRCAECAGRGGAGDTAMCVTCGGQGHRVQMRMIGPGMMQQLRTTCPVCQGNGQTFADACTSCMRTGIVQEPCTERVYVRAGECSRTLVKEGAGNESRDATVRNGDLVIKLTTVAERSRHGPNVKDIQLFGTHLVVTKTVPLVDALCGVCFEFKHFRRRCDDPEPPLPPDDRCERSFVVRVPDGYIVRQNDTFRIEGEGMPHADNPQQYGDLFIKFEVEFPQPYSLSNDQRSAMQGALGGGGGGASQAEAAAAAPNDNVVIISEPMDNLMLKRSLQLEQRRAADECGEGGNECPMQ